jgi:NADH-ubiquinone oxidoreductase chain 3
MTSTTFFIIFIPILAILLLAINLILAPHNPYQEKDSVFECGFHSFLGQNRTQFSVSFFIFALLFLLFDLEIILIYPYSVSGYTNDIYGLVIMMVFFVLLTLGFIFELGKNALTIDSRQTSSYNNVDTPVSHVFLNSAKAELVTTNLLKSSNELIELTSIILAISEAMPKFAGFINQFDTTVAQQGINVISDSKGNLSIDVPAAMSDAAAEQVKLRIGILDSLISTQGSTIKDLLHNGLGLQNKINMVDPSYRSEIFNQITEFDRLKSSYNH